MSRQPTAINIIVHSPTTAEGTQTLHQLVAEAHAAAVQQRIKHLNCPSNQREQLLDSILVNAKNSGNQHHR